MIRSHLMVLSVFGSSTKQNLENYFQQAYSDDHGVNFCKISGWYDILADFICFLWDSTFSNIL